jgi:hypothetical protein
MSVLGFFCIFSAWGFEWRSVNKITEEKERVESAFSATSQSIGIVIEEYNNSLMTAKLKDAVKNPQAGGGSVWHTNGFKNMWGYNADKYMRVLEWRFQILLPQIGRVESATASNLREAVREFEDLSFMLTGDRSAYQSRAKKIEAKEHLAQAHLLTAPESVSIDARLFSLGVSLIAIKDGVCSAMNRERIKRSRIHRGIFALGSLLTVSSTFFGWRFDRRKSPLPNLPRRFRNRGRRKWPLDRSLDR